MDSTFGNENSRVIAFESMGSGPRCRVNVYYTTGTVATCLDHPRSGKTQLFRRNMSLADLDAIFRNPRQHTGVGYFRNRVKDEWQPVGQGHFRRAECDDARRWRYIASTQEGFCNDAQANQIAALCKLWNQLRFAPPNGNDIMTTAQYFRAMPPEMFIAFNANICKLGYSPISICQDCEETGCKCTERVGSWCSIIRVVLKVARDMDGVSGVYNFTVKEEEKNDIKHVDEVMNCQCDAGLQFRQRHATFLEKLERQLRSFPAKIRRELTHWLIAKTMHGYDPFLVNPEFNWDEGHSEENPVVFHYAQIYGLSNDILRAHHDYGEMVYAEGDKGCNCHGI